MNLTIDIKGKGEVAKVDGLDSVTLTATPESSYRFNKYIIRWEVTETEYLDLKENSELYPDLNLYEEYGAYIVEKSTVENPLTLDNPDNKEVLAIFYMPIEEYLKGKVAFEITDDAIYSILLDRGIEEYTDTNDLTVKQRELLYADVLMWGSTLPSSYSGIKESDGGWSHTEGSKTITASDKKRFESMANDIYKKYRDPRLTTKVRIITW